MNAREVMTKSVVTVAPDTTLAEVAALLLAHRISGLPVLEHGYVVGIVSESDLLAQREIGARRNRKPEPWWACMFKEIADPENYVKAHAVRARDVMTMPVISVAEDTPSSKIVALLAKRGIRRVPVLRGERLVGIVTRADLVRALPLAARQSRLHSWQSDDRIRALLLEELDAQAWWLATSSVSVDRGIVHFSGIYRDEVAKHAAHVAAENIPGVRRVEDHRINRASLLSKMG